MPAFRGGGSIKTLIRELKTALERGEDTVLATIVAASGSTPRGPGAHMLVGRLGRIAGTVGGGVTEHLAEERAGTLLEERRSALEWFALEKGRVRICLQYLVADSEAVCAAAALAEECLRKGAPCDLRIDLDPASGHPLQICRGEEQSAEGVYTEPLLRPGRVYIFGGGHVAQALVPVLASVEFRCVVLEDRPEFCRRALFPAAEEIRLITPAEWGSLSIGPEDDICVMIRGRDYDTDCQAFALGTPAKYIGVIGSRERAAASRAALKERGFSEEDLRRIVTPIGLSIGAETPAELAVSIAAQLIQVRAGI